MGTRATVEASVTVQASAERAFAEVVDAEGQGRWMFGTTIYPVQGAVLSPAVGSRLVAFTGVAGLGVLDIMEVTEHEDGRRWVMAHHGNVIKGSGIFTVEPLTAGTSVVRWIEDLELPFGILGRVGWPIVKPAVRWGLRHSLKSLAAMLKAT